MNGDINGNINGGMANNNHGVELLTANAIALGQTTDNLKKEIVPANPVVRNSNQSEIDILVNNVVCSFSVRCHLNLRDISLKGCNVIYRKENGMVSMKLRKPRITASIWSSGKITCTGATSEIEAKVGARKIARVLQKLGYRVKFHNFRVVNVLGTCTMPFGIKIGLFTQEYTEAEYEPELHPGVTFKLKHLSSTLKIYSTGSITVTAPSVINTQRAIEHIYPLVHRFRKEHTDDDIRERQQAKRFNNSHNTSYPLNCKTSDEEILPAASLPPKD